jgi:hypothetical protein
VAVGDIATVAAIDDGDEVKVVIGGIAHSLLEPLTGLAAACLADRNYTGKVAGVSRDDITCQFVLS